jgi:hypothetical protein
MANDPQPPKMKFPDNAGAPVIFFEGAPVFANVSGIISITLATVRRIPDGDGGILVDMPIVATLKCSAESANELRNSLEKALLLGAPAQGEMN